MKLGCVIMASGHSGRFGRDKLTFPVEGVPMYERAFGAVPEAVFDTVAVVTRDASIAAAAAARGFKPVMNGDTTDDSAVTIRLGLNVMSTECAGILFLVCDQPWLRADSVFRIAADFEGHPENIVRLAWRGREGNPVLFPAALFPALRALPTGGSGRNVYERRRELIRAVEASFPDELRDVDYPEDLQGGKSRRPF